jgi:hypothetical protein
MGRQARLAKPGLAGEMSDASPIRSLDLMIIRRADDSVASGSPGRGRAGGQPSAASAA